MQSKFISVLLMTATMFRSLKVNEAIYKQDDRNVFVCTKWKLIYMVRDFILCQLMQNDVTAKSEMMFVTLSQNDVVSKETNFLSYSM